jgi:curved DNA-binding protein CbpA
MENMGFPGSRPAAAPHPAPQDAPTSPPSKEAPESSQEPLFTKVSSVDMALTGQIERRFQTLREAKDHFALLGVARSASTEMVKTAFLENAKLFHPDRLPESLRYLSDRVTAIFEAVNEAHENLQSDAKRAAYLQSLPAEEKTGKVSKVSKNINPEQAAVRYRRGEGLLRKQNYSDAEHEFQQARALDPKPLYAAAEAWAVYSDPARKDDAARAKQMMLDAVREDPACDRAHYQLGVIAKVEGNLDLAEDRFRETLSINPRHPEANQELSLIQRRKKKGGMRKLFGKGQ